MPTKESKSIIESFFGKDDNRPDYEQFMNVNPPATTDQIARIKSARPSQPPAAPPRHVSKSSPSFFTLKSIIMDDDDLSAEQKLRLIDKISDLYP